MTEVIKFLSSQVPQLDAVGFFLVIIFAVLSLELHKHKTQPMYVTY